MQAGHEHASEAGILLHLGVTQHKFTKWQNSPFFAATTKGEGAQWFGEIFGPDCLIKYKSYNEFLGEPPSLKAEM